MAEPIPAFAAPLREALEFSGLALTPAQIDLLEQHYALIMEVNGFINLTAIVDPREAAAKHMADSLALDRLRGRLPAGGKAFDVGPGGGFPGIPMAIAWPGWNWTLIESRANKAECLLAFVSAMLLPNVDVEPERSETLAARDGWRDAADLAVARALAPLGESAELLLPLVKPGGLAAILAGPAENPGEKAAEALRALGGGTPEVLEYDLPFEMGKRKLIVIPKAGPTSAKYPRRPGMAGKRPLF